MNDREEWRERVRDIRATSATWWWWWYIYIYIYRHPPTNCFLVSQLFGVARHAERFKLGSKPTQLYARLSILSLSRQATYVSLGIITHYVLVCLQLALPDTKVLNSLEEFCIMRVAAGNSFTRVLNPRERSVYIVIHSLTVSLYHNSSV